MKRIGRLVMTTLIFLSSHCYGQDVFLEMEISKKSAYVGEGLELKYYLYSKFNIVEDLVKLYPRLHHFLKRFYIDINSKQQVEREGVVYWKILKYSAKIFPLKSGPLVIDPFEMEVTLQKEGERKINLQSPPGELEVIPLPPLPVQENGREYYNDIGSVGHHDFFLKIHKRPTYDGGPLEIELIIEGEGAIENITPPELYPKELKIPLFDSKSSFEFFSNGISRKKFTYTFLPSVGVSLKSQIVRLLYFDLEKNGYVVKYLLIDSIPTFPRSQNTSQAHHPAKDLNKSIDKSSSFFLSLFMGRLSIMLSIINLILLGIFWRRRESSLQYALKLLQEEIRMIESKGPTYKIIHDLLMNLKEGQGEEGHWQVVLLKSQLSVNAKLYFKNLLDKLEVHTFAKDHPKLDFSFKKEYFIELINLIKMRNVHKRL